MANDQNHKMHSSKYHQLNPLSGVTKIQIFSVTLHIHQKYDLN